jgi:hypothetical protein
MNIDLPLAVGPRERRAHRRGRVEHLGKMIGDAARLRLGRGEARDIGRTGRNFIHSESSK